MNYSRKRIRKTYSCLFCRLKKKKCDQRKPACTYCIKHSNQRHCDYGPTVEPQANGVSKKPSASKSLRDPFIACDVASILASDAMPHTNTVEFLRAKVSEYEAQVRYVQAKKLVVLGVMADDTPLEFFRVPLLVCDLNIWDTKPLNIRGLFQTDPFVLASMFQVLRLYDRIKRHICKKHPVLEKGETRLRGLSRQMHRETVGFLMLMHQILNQKTPLFQYNLNLIISVYLARTPRLGLQSLVASFERDSISSIIEGLLPRTEVILYLWDNYEQYVYPFVPVIDLESFKSDLELIVGGLKFDAVGNQLKNQNYRVSVETTPEMGQLATFLVILRLSYMSLKINPNFVKPASEIERLIVNISNLESIGKIFVELAIEILNSCRALEKSNLHVLAALIHVYYYVSISEEDCNRFTGDEREILLSTIFGAATNMGMYRDWATFSRSYVNPDNNERKNDTLIYLTRKMWHLICRFDSFELIQAGSPMHSICCSKQVELPISPALSNGSPSLTIDNSYAGFTPLISLARGISKLIYCNQTPNVKDFYEKLLEVDDLIVKGYGLDRELFFVNDGNFLCKISGALGRKNIMYHLTLQKVFRFEKLVNYYTLKLKTIVVLLYHYEASGEADSYYYFLHQGLVLAAEVARSVFSCFLVDNEKFLKYSVDESFKNFNYRLTPGVGELSNNLLLFILALCYRTVTSALKLHVTVTSSASKLAADCDKLSQLIALKDYLLQLYEYFVGLYYERLCKFYLQTLKGYCVHHDIIVRFRNFDVENRESSFDQLLMKDPFVASLLNFKREFLQLPAGDTFGQIAAGQIGQLTEVFQEKKHDMKFHEWLGEQVAGWNKFGGTLRPGLISELLVKYCKDKELGIY